jgi:transcriptional regulator NrdR family protein
VPDDTEHRLEELAYQQGRRDADVDARLFSHERRLNAVNGSIEKHARNAEKLRESIDEIRESLEQRIDELISTQRVSTAVADDREELDRRRANKQLSRRTYLIGLATIMVMLLGVIVTVLTAIH